jgi:hypothetical protein
MSLCRATVKLDSESEVEPHRRRPSVSRVRDASNRARSLNRGTTPTCSNEAASRLSSTVASVANGLPTQNPSERTSAMPMGRHL